MPGDDIQPTNTEIQESDVLEVSTSEESQTYTPEGERAMRVGITPLRSDFLMEKIQSMAGIQDVVATLLVKQQEIIELINALGVQIVGDEKYLSKYKKFEVAKL